MDTHHGNPASQVRGSGEIETRKGIRTGLKNKLIWTMLGVGALPLMLAMILSYLQGTKSLQGVIGASFKALAYETSTKIDLLIEGEISRNIRHASHLSIRSAISGFNQALLALDPAARQKYIEEESTGSSQSILKSEASGVLHSFQKRKTLSVLATRALYITDAFGVLRASVNDFPEFLHTGKPDWEKTISSEKDFVYMGPVTHNEKTEAFLMTFAFPILNAQEETVGVLHHVFDVKEFFQLYGTDYFRRDRSCHVDRFERNGAGLPNIANGVFVARPGSDQECYEEEPGLGQNHGGRSWRRRSFHYRVLASGADPGMDYPVGRENLVYLCVAGFG